MFKTIYVPIYNLFLSPNGINEFKISKELSIKKLSSSEKKRIYKISKGNYFKPYWGRYTEDAYAIVYRFDGTTPPTNQLLFKLSIIEAFFRLQKKERIDIPSQMIVECEDNLEGGIGLISLHYPTHYGEKYIINKKEFKIFKDRFRKFNKHFGKLFMPILRFNSSLDHLHTSEKLMPYLDKFVDIMIALESLYLGEKDELSYRLRIRMAFFLRNKFEKEKIYTDIGIAYSLRNKIVHGMEIKSIDKSIKNKIPGGLGQFGNNIRQYLRESILAFIELLEKKGNVKFSDYIDQEIIFK